MSSAPAIDLAIDRDRIGTAGVLDALNCTLGEGPLWHPLRRELFWFDIPEQRLHILGAGLRESRELPQITSAAGWIDRERLLIATETMLAVYEIATGAQTRLAELEADNPATRANDGRADRQGGFWIGTMSKAAEPGAGAIWRWYRGELRKLYSGVTIPNSICFSPDGRFGYWADSARKAILRQRLDASGWPEGAAEVLVDLAPEDVTPDGSVVDAAGRIWNAQWGAARVAAYGPDGRFLGALPLPAQNATCPAFIGEGLDEMICTSALRGSPGAASAAPGPHGQTFRFTGMAPGLPEPAVLL